MENIRLESIFFTSKGLKFTLKYEQNNFWISVSIDDHVIAEYEIFDSNKKNEITRFENLIAFA